MATDKIIFKKQKYRNNDNMCRVRVSGSVYQKIEELAERTNMAALRWQRSSLILP